MNVENSSSNNCKDVFENLKNALSEQQKMIDNWKDEMDKAREESENKTQLKILEYLPTDEEQTEYAENRSVYLPSAQNMDLWLRTSKFQRINTIVHFLKTKLEDREFHPYIDDGKVFYRVTIDKLDQFFDFEIEIAAKIAQVNKSGEQIWEIETFRSEVNGFSMIQGFILTEYIQKDAEENKINQNENNNDDTDTTENSQSDIDTD